MENSNFKIISGIHKNKNKYLPDKKETITSCVILFVIALIGAGIFFKQFSFNPAVIQKGVFSPSDSFVSPDHKIPEPELIKSSEDLFPISSIESFDSKTLSYKINGKAELYLASGFINLKTQRYAYTENKTKWLEISVFKMQNVVNAFSVYSTQRRDDAVSLDLTDFAYKTSNAVFFAAGPYYVEIISSEINKKQFNAIFYLSKTFISKHKKAYKSIPELKLLLKNNFDKKNIYLINSNAFGYTGFKNIFVVKYLIDGEYVSGFISRKKSSAEAEKSAKGYNDFLISLGCKSLRADIKIDNAKLINVMGSFEIIYTYGKYVAGVHEAYDKKSAEKLGLKIYNTIIKAPF